VSRYFHLASVDHLTLRFVPVTVVVYLVFMALASWLRP